MAGFKNEYKFVFPKPEDKQLARQKRWYFLNKYLNKSGNEKLYNEKVLVQEHEPQPNWTLPEIDVNKLYTIPMFQFKAAQLFRFTSVNIPITVGQSVYQVPLIKKEDVAWRIIQVCAYRHDTIWDKSSCQAWMQYILPYMHARFKNE